MIGLLRFIGIFNAAVWLGAAIFFTFGAGPAFFSDEMKRMIPPPYNGVAAQLVIERYFILQYICGAIALLHLFAAKSYLGRKIDRGLFGILFALFSLGLLGGFWLQPKLKNLHALKYFGRSMEQQASAAQSFGMWHGISQLANLFMLVALLYYFWRLIFTENESRTTGWGKVRG